MKIKELLPLLKLHGRTIYDEEKQALFCNWSTSGFTVGIDGSYLKVRVTALPDQIAGMPGMPQPPEDWPNIAAVVDGSDHLINRTEIREADRWVELYNGEKGRHEVRVVKFSENARGKLGILEVATDGEFFAVEDRKTKRIEIVGDSITCGFGNEAENNSGIFRSSEENGWDAYGPRAARELGYEFSLVCESGIMAARAEKQLFDMHAMEDVYDYTDELYQKKVGQNLVKWDFENNHNDIVVLNLGTNDSNPIRFYRDFNDVEAMEQWFKKRYKEFVRQVRRDNGPDTFIICALGSMDYYLYFLIREVVQELKAEGDQNLTSFEFVAINPMFEGFGAMGHPSMKTHIRMGKELAAFIRKTLGE